MVRIFVLLVLVTSTACNAATFAQPNNFQPSSVVETVMTSTTSVSLTNVTLIAREERSPIEGVPPMPNGDIGFASVFLHLNNHQEKDAALIVKSIEIRNVSDGTVQAFSLAPQEIHLKPLENSEIVFHLTNKTGYSGREPVKAVVTYQIDDKVSIMESQPVEVEKLLIVGST